MIDPRSPDYSYTPADLRRPPFGYRPDQSAAGDPLVTIICPFYNGAAAYFDETARSIFRQSFQNWEFLIINDEATNPAALQLLEKYRHIDPRVRVIDHAVNKGLSGARNTGFAAARAEYVMLIDDDDLLEPTAVEKMVWHLESFPEYAVCNGWSVGFGAKEYLWPAGFEGGAKLLHNNSATGRALVRKSAHAKAGGYDESIRQGMEDWDFWLRLANAGMWGATIPEYLDWYRRRDDHKDRWADLDGGERFRQFYAGLQERYPRLYAGEFPGFTRSPALGQAIREVSAIQNTLVKSGQRILMILPWLTVGGADKFNLDLVEQLVARGWEVTIATTAGGDHSWAPQFGQLTPDIFALHTFLRPSDYPVFLRYLIESRKFDVVMVSNSEFGYRLLPWLRTVCPGPAYVDYLHSETPNWNRGGFPRISLGCQGFLDRTFVASDYLRGWMCERGADTANVATVRININTQQWSPAPDVRLAVRRELGIDDSLPVVTFVGRLHEDKQPQILARIFGSLTAAGVRFAGLVVGDGPERATFQRTVEKSGAARHVRILGAQPSERVRQIMQASDILVLTSLWEGIALTLYESMSIGLAVVAADVGGQRELVTAESGFLISKGAPAEEVGHYVVTLRKLIEDAALRKQVGALARWRVCEQFDIRLMGDAMDEQLRRLGGSVSITTRRAVSAELARSALTAAVEVASIRAREAQPSSEQSNAIAAKGFDESSYLRTIAESELAHIENSRAWKMLCAIKRSWPYRAIARFRFGAGWQDKLSTDPTLRLRQIQQSRYFRTLRAVKSTYLYRLYATRKYGANWDQSPAYRQ